MKKSEKEKCENIQEVKDQNIRPLTDEQFENLEIAVKGGLRLKAITEEEAQRIRDTAESLKGKDSMAVITLIAAMLPLLQAKELLAMSQMLVDVARDTYVKENIGKLRR